MADPTGCPDPSRLQQLLADRLTGPERDHLTEHVETCARCQATLDRLSAEKASWVERAGQLAGAEPPTGPALQRLLEEARPGAGPGQTRAEAGVAGAEGGSLAPPREPGHLGRVGHYEVLQVVGKGGMGTVYKAFDEVLHRVVALKLLAPELATSGTARQRFLREARAAAAVSHDHIVTIHAVEEGEPVPYLVMQYVEGTSLQEKLDRTGPLGVKEILRIGLQTAAGLAAAHKQGLVHRDIKPGNILLENGIERVKITDFGLARAADDASLTRSGVVAGTPMYMSPEQADGQPVDHRSDLFSLGSVLYAMCTGRPPFRASSALAVLRRVCDETARPVREVNAEIPEWLEAIIIRLHAKKPAERFQSAAEVAELLSQYLAHLQQPQGAAPPLTPNPSPPRGEGRKSTPLPPEGEGRKRAPLPLGERGWGEGAMPRKTWWLAAALLAVEILIVLYFCLMPRPAVPQRTDEWFDAWKREDIPPGLLALAGGGDPAQAPPELVGILGAELFRIHAHTGYMAQSPDGTLLAVPSGNTIVLFDASSGRYLRTLTGHSNNVYRLAFSPDGQRLASAAFDKTVKLWNAKTSQLLFTLEGHTDAVRGVAFSPDGTKLASASDDKMVKLWDLQTRAVLHTLTHDEGVLTVAFRPDGKELVSGGLVSNTVKVWDAQTGKEKHSLTAGPVQTGILVFSPNARFLAAGSWGGVTLWEAGTYRLLHTLSAPANGLTAFTPDGRTLWAGKNDPNQKTAHPVTRWDVETGKELAPLAVPALGSYSIYELSRSGKTLYASATEMLSVLAYDAETGKELFPRQGHTGPVFAVAVGPDGKTIASAGADRKVRLWDVATGKVVHALTGHYDQVVSLAFTPDGRRLASGSVDRTIILWEVSSGREVRTLTGHSYRWSRLQFSPDGEQLAAGGDDGSVRLWDAASGKEASPLQGPGLVRGVAFQPGTRWVVSGREDRTILFHELVNGRIGAKYATSSIVNNLAFSPERFGRYLGYVGDEGAVGLWDLSGATARETSYAGHTKDVYSLAFSPTAPLFATGGNDGTVRFWEYPGTGARVHTLGPGPFGEAVYQVAFSPRGGYLVTANNNGTIAILKTPVPPVADAPGSPRQLPDPVELAKKPSAADALRRADIPEELLKKAGGGDARKAPVEIVAILAGDFKDVFRVAISPDGKLLASSHFDHAVRLWDVATGKVWKTLSAPGVYEVAFSPDGKTLACAGDGEGLAISLWDVASGTKVRTCLGRHDRYCNRVVFSPDGTTLASAGNDGMVKLWETATGKLLRTFAGHTGAVWGVDFSPDGKLLASAGGHALPAASAPQKFQMKQVNVGGETRITFEPIVTPVKAEVKLWDVQSGWQIATLEGHTAPPAWTLFRPDGRVLATSGTDATIKLWDLATGKAQTLPNQGGKSVLTLAWRADGRVLAGRGDVGDDSLRLWDLHEAPTQFKVIPLPPGQRQWRGVAFTPEGRYLAIANEDGTIYLLRLAGPGEVFQAAHANTSVPSRAGSGKSTRQAAHMIRSRGTTMPHAEHDSSTGHDRAKRKPTQPGQPRISTKTGQATRSARLAR